MAIRSLIQLYRRSESVWACFGGWLVWRGHIATVEVQMVVCLYALYGVSANMDNSEQPFLIITNTNAFSPSYNVGGFALN